MLNLCCFPSCVILSLPKKPHLHILNIGLLCWTLLSSCLEILYPMFMYFPKWVNIQSSVRLVKSLDRQIEGMNPPTPPLALLLLPLFKQFEETWKSDFPLKLRGSISELAARCPKSFTWIGKNTHSFWSCQIVQGYYCLNNGFLNCHLGQLIGGLGSLCDSWEGFLWCMVAAF